MVEYNKKIAGMLRELNSSNEGSLLNNVKEQSDIQIAFIETILEQYRPKHIVETGTNKAYFCLICLTVLDKYDENILINTFDVAHFSKECVDLVQKEFPRHKVIFNFGNSLETLPMFTPSQKVDLFYVDGGHSFEVASSDIRNAVRMMSPLILIDDVSSEDIQKAIAQELACYELFSETDKKDERRMRLYGIKR